MSELLGDSVLDDKWCRVIEWLSQLRDNKSFLSNQALKLIMENTKIYTAGLGRFEEVL